MTCFLTFLTLLTFLTVWADRHGFLSEKSENLTNLIARVGRKAFFSLSYVFATRARKQICQKIPTQIQRAPAVPKREVA